MGSFRTSGHDARWDFIDFLEQSDRDAAGTSRRPEGESVRRRADPSLPVPEPQRILRCGANRFASDDVFARHRMLADFDPDLPVGIEVAEGQMLALDTLDDATTDVLGFQHPCLQLLVRLRQQEIRARKFEESLDPQPVDNLVEGTGSWNLGKLVAAPVMHGHGGTIRHKLDIGITTGSADAEFVRAAQSDVA